jgi:hypothetical protein
MEETIERHLGQSLKAAGFRKHRLRFSPGGCAREGVLTGSGIVSRAESLIPARKQELTDFYKGPGSKYGNAANDFFDQQPTRR